MNRCLAAFLALLFASLTISSACFAQANGEATLLVNYDDLDLSTPAGVKALQRRIELTANRVCTDATGPFPTGVDFYCKVDALRDARTQIPAAIAQQRLSRSAAVAATDSH
jgi:UrcA family protein